MSRIHSRKFLKPNRSFLRNKSTSAEASLWNILKSKQLDNRKFRRQHSIGNFIVDFYCPSERLIIELDGDGHGDYVQIQKDEERDEILKGLGYSIIRFENRFVFQDPDFVKAEIISRFRKD
jgi:very-short-patch-repair endonuclease